MAYTVIQPFYRSVVLSENIGKTDKDENASQSHLDYCVSIFYAEDNNIYRMRNHVFLVG